MAARRFASFEMDIRFGRDAGAVGLAWRDRTRRANRSEDIHINESAIRAARAERQGRRDRRQGCRQSVAANYR